MGTLISAVALRPSLSKIHLIVKKNDSAHLIAAALQELHKLDFTRNICCASFSGAKGADVSQLVGILPSVLPSVHFISLCELSLAAYNEPGSAAALCLSHLKELHLCEVDGVDITFFCDLTRLSALADLSIDCYAEETAVPTIVPALAQLTTLQRFYLNISYTPYPLMTALCGLTSLTSLHWMDHAAGGEPWSCVADSNAALAALSSLCKLRNLCLPQLILQDEGMRGITAMTALTLLGVGSLGLLACTPGAGAGLKTLEADAETGTFFLPLAASTRLFGAALSCAKDLTVDAYRLDVSCKGNACPVSEHGVQMVADNLLQLLPCVRNDCCSLTLRAGCEALPAGPVLHALRASAVQLTSCNLYDMRLGRQDLELLAAACPHLGSLELGRCLLGMGALMAVVPVPHLVRVCLSSLILVLPHDLYKSLEDDGFPCVTSAATVWFLGDITSFTAAWSAAHSSGCSDAGSACLDLQLGQFGEDVGIWSEVREVLQYNAPRVKLLAW